MKMVMNTLELQQLKMLIKNIFSIFLMQEKEDKAILSLISFLTVLFENKSLI